MGGGGVGVVGDTPDFKSISSNGDDRMRATSFPAIESLIFLLFCSASRHRPVSHEVGPRENIWYPGYVPRVSPLPLFLGTRLE